MRRTLPGYFRTVDPSNTPPIPLGFNIQDQLTTDPSPAPFFAEWSQGATIIDIIDQLKPQANQHWSVISVTVQAQLTFVYPVSNYVYGKLGRIIAALITDPTVITFTASGGQPWQFPMLPLPQDMSLAVDLWNPANDPMPPADPTSVSGKQTVTNALTVSQTIQPPLPIDLTGGLSLGIGIWMTPSLFGFGGSGLAKCGMVGYNARYQVNYDDNQG